VALKVNQNLNFVCKYAIWQLCYKAQRRNIRKKVYLPIPRNQDGAKFEQIWKYILQWGVVY
jgi:hypothetical protein